MLLFLDPFLLFRAAITLVLGAIWLYTMVEGISMILALVSRTKRDESANRDAKIDAKRALAEAEAASGRIPKAVIQRLRDSRRRLSNERLLRVAKKAGFLKLMDFLSLKTLSFVWREVALILFLLVAIAITLTYYYSNALG